VIELVQVPIGMGMATSLRKKEIYFKDMLDETLSTLKGAQEHGEIDTIQTKSILKCPLTL